MGSTAHVVVVGGDPEDLLSYATRRLRELEFRWTRFDPDSTMSRLNHGNGEPMEVDLDTLALVARTKDGWALTNGLFDPTVLPAMVATGYSKSLDANGDSSAQMDGEYGGPSPGCAAIALDTSSHLVTLPAGVGIDPGGIGKGLAADLVAAELIQRAADGAMVNVGGDLRAIGLGPTGRNWVVDIEDPFDETSYVAMVSIVEGAIATTTPHHRRWMTAAGPGIHVIDPRTGRPINSDIASVTVLAAHAWMAEAVTKAVAVAGASDGIEIIEEAGLAGLLVTADGDIRLSARMGAFL